MDPMPRKTLPPEPTEKITLMVPESLAKALRAKAKSRDLKLSAIIREALALYLGRKTPKVRRPGRPWDEK